MQKSLPFEKSSSHRHLFNAETPIKILYVDDNEDHLLLVKEWLEKSRKTLQVVLERNGEKALEELEKHSFNLILLDYQLAGIDGLEVLRRLKQRGVACPIVMLTGQGDEQTACEAIKLGAKDYFSKGAGNLGDLVRMIEKLVAD